MVTDRNFIRLLLPPGKIDDYQLYPIDTQNWEKEIRNKQKRIMAATIYVSLLVISS